MPDIWLKHSYTYISHTHIYVQMTYINSIIIHIYIHMNIYTFNRSYYNYYHSWHIHSIGVVKIIITQGQGKQKGWHLVEKCRKLRIARNSGHQPIMSAGLEHVTTYNRISYISFFPFFCGNGEGQIQGFTHARPVFFPWASLPTFFCGRVLLRSPD